MIKYIFFYSAKIEIFLERHFTIDIWIIAIIKSNLFLSKEKFQCPVCPVNVSPIYEKMDTKLEKLSFSGLL